MSLNTDKLKMAFRPGKFRGLSRNRSLGPVSTKASEPFRAGNLKWRSVYAWNFLFEGNLVHIKNMWIKHFCSIIRFEILLRSFPGASEHFSGPSRQEYSRALKNKDVNYSSLMLTLESKSVPARRRTELKCDAHRKYSRLLKDTNYEFRKNCMARQTSLT